jgi:hypothetical protein
MAFSYAHNYTHKKRFRLDYMKRSNIFFQDWAFDHRVVFKHLHKGLRPFTNAGLHKRGVWSRVMFGGGHVYPRGLHITRFTTTASGVHVANIASCGPYDQIL